jgi:hypothetical protein
VLREVKGPPPTRAVRIRRFVREHPVTVGVMVAGIVGGAVAALVLPIGPPDMSPLLKVVGGAILGFCLALFPLGYRLFD